MSAETAPNIEEEQKDEDQEGGEVIEIEQAQARKVIDAGETLLKEALGKTEKEKDLIVYLDALRALRTDEDRLEDAVHNIANALNTNQDKTGALIWALKKSGLVKFEKK